MCVCVCVCVCVRARACVRKEFILNFTENFTKISAESPLYWEVPSYRHLSVYTSNISYLITQSRPNRPGSQSHKHHRHHNHNIYNIH